jgi:chromosome segregation ATPase
VSLYEFQKEISACETKIQYQQNLYESVLSDKKLHAKHLLDAQAEIVEMKRKLKIMNFSINGSKEEIYAKETAKQKEAAELAKITKEIDGIHDEIKNLKSQQELAQSYIRTQVSEQSKLANFAKEAEMEKIREEKALNSLVSERDNLSAQLMRQNDELTKVYDRIKTVQSSLNRGEIYYNEKCKTIRNITLEILDLKNQYRSLVLETGNLADLKKHLTNVEEELTQGQIRFKALEEQLKYPMNIHRWRKMESSNPQEFELMKMIQCLQKKLISLSKDDHEKQSLISKKEELYLHLKELLAKQVGPEAMEQIEEYETVLKDKNLQLKHMSAELNMYQAQVREYRYSISQADKSLEELKKEIMERYNAQMSEAKYAKAKKPTRIKSAIKKTSDSSSQQLGQAPSNGMGPDSASLESETQSKAAETPQPAPDNGIDAPSGQTDAPSGQTDASSVYTEDVPASEPVLNETNDSS